MQPANRPGFLVTDGELGGRLVTHTADDFQLHVDAAVLGEVADQVIRVNHFDLVVDL